MGGKELLDMEARVESLEIYPNTILELLVRGEDDGLEIVPNSKKFERGFEGTGLVSSAGLRQTPDAEVCHQVLCLFFLFEDSISPLDSHRAH